MYPNVSSSRHELEQLGWRSAVIRATPVSLTERSLLTELPNVAGRVSVVTISFNAAKTIADAMASVASQTYGDVEYIVIDGGSTDGTIEAIRGCAHVDLAISHRDRGIADAFNRGIALTTGEYVAFINADDVWPADHLEKAVEVMRGHPSSAFAFGDLVRADEETGEFYVMRGDADYRKKLQTWPPEFNHPSFLTRRKVFEQVGLFDLSFRICMDFEWLMRLDRAGLYGVKSEELWVVMRCGGVSDQLNKMFGEVAAVLTLGGMAPGKVAWLHFVARAKTSAKHVLQYLGFAESAGHIRHAINRNFESSDPLLIESARRLLQSKGPSTSPEML